MKRSGRDIKKIIWMKWKLVGSAKGVTRKSERPHSLKKHQSHPSQMNLCQSLLIQAWITMIRSLRMAEGQAMEKITLQRQEKI